MARNTRETTCPATLAVLTWILKKRYSNKLTVVIGGIEDPYTVIHIRKKTVSSKTRRICGPVLNTQIFITMENMEK